MRAARFGAGTPGLMGMARSDFRFIFASLAIADQARNAPPIIESEGPMPAAPSPLADLLARRTREGELYEKLPEDRVRCFACGHRCLIPPGRDGMCRVRFNEGGTLKVPFGYVGRGARRSRGEEAVLPRPARRARPLLRDARLRLPLRLLLRAGDGGDDHHGRAHDRFPLRAQRDGAGDGPRRGGACGRASTSSPIAAARAR